MKDEQLYEQYVTICAADIIPTKGIYIYIVYIYINRCVFGHVCACVRVHV